MKFKGFILGLLLCCFTCVAFANVPLMPVKDLKPGMQGIGKTVIKGDTIEEFNVEVLGVTGSEAAGYSILVPYSTEVIVEKFDESDNAIHIMAVIYVERDSQKGIIIGRGGAMLKRVGSDARKDIEQFFGKRVFLEMFVKVEPNWRNRENKLRAFGYIAD